MDRGEIQNTSLILLKTLTVDNSKDKNTLSNFEPKNMWLSVIGISRERQGVSCVRTATSVTCSKLQFKQEFQ